MLHPWLLDGEAQPGVALRVGATARAADDYFARQLGK
jgi:hypothetical protein